MTLLTAEVIRPRTVPLGESDGLTVRRTLPTAGRSLVGPWCFVDHFGPDVLPSDVTRGGMQVPAHPHTCLQTVSWLFEGAIEHRDSTGGHAIIEPGMVAVMTAGRGIAHSERSVAGGTLRGLQLWVALPDASRFDEPSFATEAITPVDLAAGVTARVFAGTLGEHTTGLPMHSPMVGAELLLAPGASVRLPLTVAFEHGLLLEDGDTQVDGHPIDAAHLAFLPIGRSHVQLSSSTGARIVLLGGTPFGESIVMWWNLIGRSHEEIVQFRAQWEAELAGTTDETVFGLPVGDDEAPLHAPELPPVRLKART